MPQTVAATVRRGWQGNAQQIKAGQQGQGAAFQQCKYEMSANKIFLRYYPPGERNLKLNFTDF